MKSQVNSDVNGKSVKENTKVDSAGKLMMAYNEVLYNISPPF